MFSYKPLLGIKIPTIFAHWNLFYVFYAHSAKFGLWPPMRRSARVKTVVSFYSDFFPFEPGRRGPHPSIRTLWSAIVSLGTGWADSMRQLLLPGCCAVVYTLLRSPMTCAAGPTTCVPRQPWPTSWHFSSTLGPAFSSRLLTGRSRNMAHGATFLKG